MSMPLENEVIARLNEITAMVTDKSSLSESDTEEIKSAFRDLVEGGHRYDVGEVECWFENEGSWTSRGTRTRIANISAYVQDKHQQTAHLRILSDDDSGDGGGCGH